MKKNTITILMYLSKINDQTYVAIDGNLIDLNEFGITGEMFSAMGHYFENIVQKIMLEKNEKQTIPESNF